MQAPCVAAIVIVNLQLQNINYDAQDPAVDQLRIKIKMLPKYNFKFMQ